MEAWGDIPDMLAAAEARGIDHVVTVPLDGLPPPGARVIDHPHPRLLLCTAGCHRLRLPGGALLELTPGIAATFEPGTWHVIEGGAPRSYLSALCSPHDIRFFRRHHDGQHEPGDPRTWFRPADPQVLQAIALMRAADPEDRALAATLVLRLLRRAIRAQPGVGGAEATWQRLQAYCEEEWAAGLGREAAARACGIDPAYVTALFHRFAGCSFQDWLTERRLREARSLLLARPELSVGAVASSCGYSDARYFRRMFRRRYGVAPSALRSSA